MRLTRDVITFTSLLLLGSACGPASNGPQILETDEVRGDLSSPVLTDGRLVQEGRFTAMLPGRPSRDFRITLTSTMTRGDGDIVLEIIDESDDTQTVLALDDEQAYGELETPDGAILAATYNADETISVGGTDFDTPEEAAEQIFTSEAAASVTPESLAVASAILETTDDASDTAVDRSAAKKTVAKVWKTIVDIATIVLKNPPVLCMVYPCKP